MATKNLFKLLVVTLDNRLIARGTTIMITHIMSKCFEDSNQVSQINYKLEIKVWMNPLDVNFLFCTKTNKWHQQLERIKTSSRSIP